MKRKEKKGVTLIALVITVIILIILAGVTLNIVIKDNGILAMAKQAKQETKKGEEKENVDLKHLKQQTEAILDKIPPTINLSGVGTASNATLTAIVTDNESGVSKFAWLNENREPRKNEWQECTENKITKTITSTGIYYLWVIDKEGNTTRKQATVSKHTHISSCYGECGGTCKFDESYIGSDGDDYYKYKCNRCGSRPQKNSYEDDFKCTKTVLKCTQRSKFYCKYSMSITKNKTLKNKP